MLATHFPLDPAIETHPEGVAACRIAASGSFEILLEYLAE
jgi:hypothetical protein